MKKLKRMLLIHWHNYEKEVIDFDMINFLTGKTAAGKSTLMDAMQLVLLGDTTGTFFNKAANSKSTRTLKGYLFGEMGDDGDASFRCLRTGRFTSYVAMEFEDTERGNRFTAGIVCDCYKDQSFDYKWFILHSQGFPDNLFVDPDTHIPYDIPGLRAWLNRTLGRRKKGLYEFYETNKRYQEVTLGKFGQVKQKYRLLLRKAVPFSPITDIEKFITESICDVKNTIDVEQMQSDIRQYKSLEEDARQTRERIDLLQAIRDVDQSYEREKEKYRQQSYIVIRGEQAEYEEQEEQCRIQIGQKRQQAGENQTKMNFLTDKINRLEKDLKNREDTFRGSDIVRREKELKLQIETLTEDIQSMEKGIGTALGQVKSYGASWNRQLAAAIRAGFEPSGEFHPELSRMEQLGEEGLWTFSFHKAAEMMEGLRRDMEEYRAELKKRSGQLKQDITALDLTLRNLKKGIKPFPESVSSLKRLLEEELFCLGKKTVEVSVLADLLEIRDPRWRNAIEGYLDKQKFYLLVPPEYYRNALRIYDRQRRESRIFDAGLVDVGKLRQEFTRKPMEGSLAEEIETNHPDARLYADYLLGSVIKCEYVEELDRYKTAITPSVMLYKGYVGRKLNPSRYASPFIGRRSMELLIAQKQEELAAQEQLYNEVMTRYQTLTEAVHTAILSPFEADQHQQAVEQKEKLEQTKRRRDQVQKMYDELDFTYLDRMQQEIRDLKADLDEKEEKWHTLDKENALLRTEADRLEEQALPEIGKKIGDVRKRISDTFPEGWIRKTGEPRFLEVQGQQKEYTVPLKERFYAAMRQTEKQRDALRKERTQKRSEYNSLYKMPYDIELESNRYFDKELDELLQIRLPEYLEKIQDSRQKAYDQFRDDFIAKIKSNIEAVSRQIEELNDSLKKSVFGTDRYRFVKSPRPEYREYYDMIMDPLLMDTGGWNIASQSFNQKYQKEIEGLFQLLILNETNVSAQRRAEYEKSIKKFTDYRTYLVFDLIVTDDRGNEQRLSRTLLKKSGGETQIPFYIALLASFSQVCRIRNKNQNNTIRVILLDEAFSKMDGERIQESIRLLRRFGLQAIFSAPPEKIPDIAPLADRTIVVYKDGGHAFTRHFDPKQMEELTEE